MGINKINLVGRLGKDPEFRYVDKNTAIARLRLAVNNYDYDSNGNNKKYTTWVNVVLWNRLAFVARHGLCKGTAIAIEGKVANRSYVDKEGTKHYVLEVDAESIETISKPKLIQDKDKDSKVGNISGENVDEETGEIISDMELHKGTVEPVDSHMLSIKDFEEPKKNKGRKKKSEE